MRIRKSLAIALVIYVLGNGLYGCKSDKKEPQTVSSTIKEDPSTSEKETVDEEESSKETESNTDTSVNDYSPEEGRAIIFGKAMSYYQGFETVEFNQYIDTKLIYLSECIKDGFMGVEWDVKPAWEYILDHVEGY